MRKIDAILQEVGLITLKFSKLEHLTLEYISVIISGYATVTNYMIFQDQTLHQKVETLEKLIHLQSSGHTDKIHLETIQRIKKLKDERNLFIHGDWGDIQGAIENDYETISVKSIKYKYQISKFDGSKSWTPGKNDQFTIARFKKMSDEVDLLLNEIKERIKENENIPIVKDR